MLLLPCARSQLGFCAFQRGSGLSLFPPLSFRRGRPPDTSPPRSPHLSPPLPRSWDDVVAGGGGGSGGGGSRKDVDMSPFNVNAKMWDPSSAKLSINDRLNLCFSDSDLIPLFMQARGLGVRFCARVAVVGACSTWKWLLTALCDCVGWRRDWCGAPGPSDASGACSNTHEPAFRTHEIEHTNRTGELHQHEAPRVRSGRGGADAAARRRRRQPQRRRVSFGFGLSFLWFRPCCSRLFFWLCSVSFRLCRRSLFFALSIAGASCCFQSTEIRPLSHLSHTRLEPHLTTCIRISLFVSVSASRVQATSSTRPSAATKSGGSCPLPSPSPASCPRR